MPRKLSFILISSALVLSGCVVTEGFVTPSTSLPYVPAKGQIEAAIKFAAASRGWTLDRTGPNAFTLQRTSHTYSATLGVTYTENSWTINKKEVSDSACGSDSPPECLDAARIIYNSWARNLDKSIKIELAKIRVLTDSK